MKFIHVAGTKGKGSVCAFCEAILRQCGVKTGLYTSPHLVSVRERIRIDGKPISQELFAKYFWKTFPPLLEWSVSFIPSLASERQIEENRPGYAKLFPLLDTSRFSSL